ncbi:hypothetical protein [Enterobacter asburiae]|uniref:hypothetical protein n=1 Tax=Enterobacter asburiae TaxID=61645 RepID=UPI0032D91009
MQVSFWLCESNQNTTEPEVVKRQAHNMEAHSPLSLMGIGLLAGGVCFQLWAIARYIRELTAVNNFPRGFNMKDFNRQPPRQQAIRLNWFEIKLRQLCYFLAQKGDPEL